MFDDCKFAHGSRHAEAIEINITFQKLIIFIMSAHFLFFCLTYDKHALTFYINSLSNSREDYYNLPVFYTNYCEAAL